MRVCKARPILDPSEVQIYRAVDARGEPRTDAGTVFEINHLAAVLEPGRYVLDEIRGEPRPSGHTSRR